MPHTHILYDEINKRAEKTFEGNAKQVAVEEFPKWCRHWISTTEAFRDEAISQGLTNTAAELDRIIAETRRDHARV